MTEICGVPLKTMVKDFSMEVVFAASDYDRIQLTVEDISRPGLQIAGYMDHFEPMRLQVIGNVDGEERYDGDTSPHSHFICRSCGKVADLPFSEVAMPDTSGVGRMDSCSVTFYGCCNECL